MERLTTDTYLINAREDEETRRNHYILRKAYDKVFDRLQEFEVAEEQGLLHKAPVPNGTTIFIFSYIDLFDETMEVSKDSYLHGYTETVIGEMNKDWFLTREAAEGALKGSQPIDSI